MPVPPKLSDFLPGLSSSIREITYPDVLRVMDAMLPLKLTAVVLNSTRLFFVIFQCCPHFNPIDTYHFVKTFFMPSWPVDGIFTEWAQWSDCSVTCANGTRYRTRECVGPFFGGSNCTGPWDEEEVCLAASCPGTFFWILIFSFLLNKYFAIKVVVEGLTILYREFCIDSMLILKRFTSIITKILPNS